ncbi:MAG TPA: hypothetical protein VGL78_00890 [Solirubrobacteraceae bacterium]
MGEQVANPHHDRPWFILALVGNAQLMVVLDATVMNIALPTAQKALHFSDVDRQWVITAYSLTFGTPGLEALAEVGSRFRSPAPPGHAIQSIQ